MGTALFSVNDLLRKNAISHSSQTLTGTEPQSAVLRGSNNCDVYVLLIVGGIICAMQFLRPRARPGVTAGSDLRPGLDRFIEHARESLMMRNIALAALAILSPLAGAADQPGAKPAPPVVHVGIEHSHSFSLPAGAKASDAKPRVAEVEADGHLIPLHLHIDEQGNAQIECREAHAVSRPVPPPVEERQ
jgi:hypothetical protein